MLIPILPKPVDDELVCGWLAVTAMLNGNLTIPQRRAFKETFLRFGSYIFDYEKYASNGLVALCDRYHDMWPDFKKTVLRNTTFAVRMPFMHYGNQALEIHGMARTASRPSEITPAPYLLRGFVVCPECLKEDLQMYQRPVLHTVHHIAGLSVCHKHGVSLQRILFTSDGFHLEAPETAEVTEEAIKASRLAAALYESPVFTDVTSIRKIINRYTNKKSKDFRYLFLALSSITDNADAIREMADPPFFDLSKAWRGTDILEATDQPIIRVRCKKCKAEYYTHPIGLQNKAGCPYCNKKLSETQLINRQLQTVGDGAYQLDNSFASWGTEKTRILHSSCGEEKKNCLIQYVWNGYCCDCERARTVARAEEKLKKLHCNAFKVKEVSRGRITVIRKIDGVEYKLLWNSFFAAVQDRKSYLFHCTPRIERTPENLEKIVNTYGKVFKVLSYNPETEHCEIKCLKCGTKFSVLWDQIKKNKRCPECGAGAPVRQHVGKLTPTLVQAKIDPRKKHFHIVSLTSKQGDYDLRVRCLHCGKDFSCTYTLFKRQQFCRECGFFVNGPIPRVFKPYTVQMSIDPDMTVFKILETYGPPLAKYEILTECVQCGNRSRERWETFKRRRKCKVCGAKLEN